jgi:hypothetical protein
MQEVLSLSIYNKSGYRDKFNSQQLRIMDSSEKNEKSRQQRLEKQKAEQAILEDEIKNLKKYLTDDYVQEHHIEHSGTIEFNFRKNGTSEKVQVVIEKRENFDRAWKMVRGE